MIRKSLYLAASAAVLLTAAQAQAAEITGTGTFGTVTSTTASGAYLLAQELTYFTAYSSATAAAATKGTATFKLNPTASFTTGESLLLTLDLTGGVFAGNSATITTGTVTGTTCIISNVVPVTPVATGATSAQYLLTLSGTCSGANNGINIGAPVQVTGSNMSIGAMLQQSFGGQLINVDGGRTSARFVTVAPAFSASVSSTSSVVTALVSQGYRELDNNGATLATYNVDVDSDVHVNLSGTTASASNISGVTLTATALTGSFTGYNLASNSGLFTTGSSTATVGTVRVRTSATTSGFVEIVDNTNTATTSVVEADAVIPASTFSLAVNVDLAAGLTDFTATGSMGALVRDGTSFVAPWVALGSTVANSTIRLANNGSADTGPIQVTLKSSTGGAPTTRTVTITNAQLINGSTLAASGGIPAGGTVFLSGAALASAMGTTAANGDLEISVEAQPQFVSGKVRVTQASGQIFETSLGNLSN